MALRDQLPEEKVSYKDPVFGINLQASNDDLRPGEARKMQNLVYNGGTRSRTGSSRLNSTSFGAFPIKGGHRYYYGGANASSHRLIAYSTRISSISSSGTETVLSSGMTTGLDTFMTTWSITDRVYIGNQTDTLRQYDGNTATFSTVTGTNIPIARTGVFPILDRLMCITTNGIERCDPRDPTIWSSNSSWATLRPSRVGLFTHGIPYTIRGTDSFYPGLIAFQANAYYVISGTDFGSDVTAASPPTGEDASIKLLDPQVGTSSPYSVCTVPGVGLFWFTSDLNVYWLPEGSLTGSYIGDKLKSTCTVQGIESTNTAHINQVWMAYAYPYLMLGIPTGSNSYASTQFWLDIRAFPKEVVWYGPMTGQTVSRVWVETQNGDNAVYGGEGNSANGAFVYQLQVPGRFTDAVGTSDNGLTRSVQTPYPDFGWPSRQKYVQEINLDMYLPTGTATMNLYDLDATIATNLTISEV